ncbi:MAG: 16S rRNA (uracil(1498)-N(3))-methyltransferase [Halieaceae bacterium]|jgi:16S rRNA (uracil1498-N3)-methyltransferase|nr:16S rRNA (uracil(1498)-N(3))-methyltransferase [Halieaceae bacterium]
MRIPRIYTGQELQANAEIELEAGPSQHLSRVLRMKVGDALLLFNGSGGQYRATISSIDRKAVVVASAALETLERESPLHLELGIAVSRGERMDWVVQKATELGVTRIAPLVSKRTEVKLGAERGEKKLKHWQQIATSACEQCGRNRLPQILAPQALADWIQQVQADLRLVLHHNAGNTDPAALPPRSVALLIGPEGGLSPEEIEAAERTGFAALQLGPRVLRTETAPLAAIAILQARWGDMGPH